jgi:hypothetical protein
LTAAGVNVAAAVLKNAKEAEMDQSKQHQNGPSAAENKEGS